MRKIDDFFLDFDNVLLIQHSLLLSLVVYLFICNIFIIQFCSVSKWNILDPL